MIFNKKRDIPEYGRREAFRKTRQVSAMARPAIEKC